jgi:hypothetical protein
MVVHAFMKVLVWQIFGKIGFPFCRDFEMTISPQVFDDIWHASIVPKVIERHVLE